MKGPAISFKVGFMVGLLDGKHLFGGNKLNHDWELCFDDVRFAPSLRNRMSFLGVCLFI